MISNGLAGSSLDACQHEVSHRPTFQSRSLFDHGLLLARNAGFKTLASGEAGHWESVRQIDGRFNLGSGQQLAHLLVQHVDGLQRSDHDLETGDLLVGVPPDHVDAIDGDPVQYAGKFQHG